MRKEGTVRFSPPRTEPTPRQIEAITYIVQGYSMEETAAKMYITPSGVSTLLYYARDTMDVTSTLELVLLCMKRGIVPARHLYHDKELSSVRGK